MSCRFTLAARTSITSQPGRRIGLGLLADAEPRERVVRVLIGDERGEQLSRPRVDPEASPPMIKIVALIKRKPDLSFEQFSDYYLHEHAKLCWSLAPPEVAERVVLYSQSHARALGRGPASAPFDCVTEIGFADEDGLRAWNEWYLGPDGAELRADEDELHGH